MTDADGSGPEPDGAAATGDAAPADPAGEAAAEAVLDEAAEAVDPSTISVEDLVADLERVATERDTYLDQARRLQAEFENYRKAVGKRETEARERANEGLAAEMLTVLDAADAAAANGADDVAPIAAMLLDTLTKQGLERLDPAGQPFDPEQHEAVMHTDDSEAEGPVVEQVLRVGYAWRGRTLRAAMVQVRG